MILVIFYKISPSIPVEGVLCLNEFLNINFLETFPLPKLIALCSLSQVYNLHDLVMGVHTRGGCVQAKLIKKHIYIFHPLTPLPLIPVMTASEDVLSQQLIINIIW